MLANVPTRNDYEDARCSLGLTVTGIGFHWAHWNWDFMKVLMKVLMKVELTTGSRRVHGSRRVLVALAVYCSFMSSYSSLVERQSIALACPRMQQVKRDVDTKRLSREKTTPSGRAAKAIVRHVRSFEKL